MRTGGTARDDHELVKVGHPLAAAGPALQALVEDRAARVEGARIVRRVVLIVLLHQLSPQTLGPSRAVSYPPESRPPAATQGVPCHSRGGCIVRCPWWFALPLTPPASDVQARSWLPQLMKTVAWTTTCPASSSGLFAVVSSPVSSVLYPSAQAASSRLLGRVHLLVRSFILVRFVASASSSSSLFAPKTPSKVLEKIDPSKS